jgi:RNA polymerase sigma-70 factor (ECF subfamily)
VALWGSRVSSEAEAAAFRRLYEAQVRFVWRTLLRFGVPERDVPDAVQEVFLVVHRRLPELQGAATLGWIFATCRRVASDRRRLAHARRELPSGDATRGDAAPVADDAPDAAALVDHQRARALLESILTRMPEPQREVFVLFELEGLSGDEIADVLGIPVGTVRSRLRLAREQFQQAVVRARTRTAGGPAVALRTREV